MLNPVELLLLKVEDSLLFEDLFALLLQSLTCLLDLLREHFELKFLCVEAELSFL